MYLESGFCQHAFSSLLESVHILSAPFWNMSFISYYLRTSSLCPKVASISGEPVAFRVWKLLLHLHFLRVHITVEAPIAFVHQEA